MASAALATRSWTSAATAATPSSVTSYTFGPGPLGLDLMNAPGGLIRADVDPGEQAESLGMTESYAVVGLNGTELPAGCTKDELIKMLEQVKSKRDSLQSQPSGRAWDGRRQSVRRNRAC